MLAPIFDEAADKVAAEFPEPGRVVLAKVDCDKESKKWQSEQTVVVVTIVLFLLSIHWYTLPYIKISNPESGEKWANL